jgi:hypothetical protein
MVTKGYQKGVYDRVTEGTWESGQKRDVLQAGGAFSEEISP